MKSSGLEIAFTVQVQSTVRLPYFVKGYRTEKEQHNFGLHSLVIDPLVEIRLPLALSA